MEIVILREADFGLVLELEVINNPNEIKKE